MGNWEFYSLGCKVDFKQQMASRDDLTGPRRLDFHQASKILPKSHDRCKRSIVKYLDYLMRNKFNPETWEEHDDLMVEYKIEENITKSEMEALVAGFELVFPRAKGSLVWSRACLAGWSVVHNPKHTVPLCRGPAHLMAAHMAALGSARGGAALLLQQELGLRPSEILSLRPADVSLPEDVVGARGPARATLGLGVRSHTKAKRPQAVVLRDGRLIGILRRLRADAESQGRETLVGLSYEQYRRLVHSAEAAMGVTVGWSPRSPRAGFATDRLVEGWSFTDIREAGRCPSAKVS